MILVSCSCVTTPSQNNSIGENQIKVVTFYNEFRTFWLKAKNATFEDQLKLWTSIVEKPHQQFFDYFVWPKRISDNDFANHRRSQLQKTFEKFRDNETEIDDYLGQFEEILSEQLRRYQAVFPDFNFPVNCYGIVGGNFLGRAGIARRFYY